MAASTRKPSATARRPIEVGVADDALGTPRSIADLRARFPAACLDCPAARVGCFEVAVGYGTSPCRFVKGTLSARAPIPVSWSDDYTLVLVRRGVVVRTRAPSDGPSVAIDCVGPGGVLPLAKQAVEIGYAATEVLVCLYPRVGLEETLVNEPRTALDLIFALTGALERVELLAEARGQGTADARVARVLAVLADKMMPPIRREKFPSGLQQRDLARLAGVRHESFCRALGKLERAGIVRRMSEGLQIERYEELAAFKG